MISPMQAYSAKLHDLRRTYRSIVSPLKFAYDQAREDDRQARLNKTGSANRARTRVLVREARRRYYDAVHIQKAAYAAALARARRDYEQSKRAEPRELQRPTC